MIGRPYLYLAGAAGLAAAVCVLSATIIERDRFKRLYEDDHQVVEKARACDVALTGNKAFELAMACTPAVKTVVAQRNAAREDTTNLKTELQRVRNGRDAAIARAEARATTQAKRTLNVQTVLDAAPRGGDGLVELSGDSLRLLDEGARPGG